MFVSVVGGIGYPLFVFYGCGLYAILAPLVEIWGPDGGMRVAVLLAFLLPNIVLARLMLRCLGNSWIAGCVTTVLSTSIYQLTNVYARGAMTEFFAYQLLLFGLIVLMDAFLDEEGLDRSLKEIVGLTSGALGMLTHPPTAYLSILFLGAPAGAFVNLLRSSGAFSVRRLWPVLIALVIIALPVATWMALAWSYSPTLALNDLGTGKLNFFPWSVDHWLARLLPWPMDFRVDDEGLDLVSAPYLSAPINSAALLLLIHLAGWALGNEDRQSRLRSSVVLFMIAIATAASVSLLVSLPVGMFETSNELEVKPLATMAYSDELSWRDRVFGRVQFAYRLVNITNLSLVFGCLAVILLTKQHQWRYNGTELFFNERSRAVLIVATTICMLTACIKTVDVFKAYWLLPAHNNRFLLDANGVWRPRGMRAWVSADNIRKLGREVRHTASLPSTEYGLASYATPELFPAYDEDSRRPIEQTVNLRQEDASGAAATASCEQPCALMTDLVVSPFFQVSLNGTIVAGGALRSSGDGFVTILAPRGEHRITVSLGTWATRLYGHATLAVAGLFWCSVGIVLIRTVRSAVSSPVNGRLDFTEK